jgi:trigger factor
MQVKVTNPTNTRSIITITASQDGLNSIKKHALSHFGSVKVPGFREGKAPADILEKHVDPNLLQSKFIEEAVEHLYVQALRVQQIKAVGQPSISIKKFVPFTELEFEAEVDVIGQIKLPDYKKIKLTKQDDKVGEADVANVLESLKKQLSEKKDVDRAAAMGDQVWIDFKGVDAKGEPIKGADGKDYPLQLGSKTFIPGFEENLMGLKAGEEKTFELTFPKDYGVKALASKKVTFTASVTKVQEVVEPKLDDSLAAKAGPFKTVAELKADIKKQLKHERQHEAQRNFESELIKIISDKSVVEVPDSLIDEQVDRLMQETRQNANYRGQTMEEYLSIVGKTEEQYKKEDLRPQAETRTKASIVLSEISELEKIDVTPEEIGVRLQLYRGQYQDPQMQAELDKPETRREIASRLLTEKTMARLVDYATKR